MVNEIPPRWALLDTKKFWLDDTAWIVATTDTPCHLYMRWSHNPPFTHKMPVFRRGVFVRNDFRICFTVYRDNEQNEAGDTLVHTFTKPNWPICETRYYYFHGTVSGETSPSTSPPFTLHHAGPTTTAIFYPDAHPEVTSVDGRVQQRQFGMTWSALHAAAGNESNDVSIVDFVALVADPWDEDRWLTLTRAVQLYDTHTLGATATIHQAKVFIRGHLKWDDLLTSPDIAVYASRPASNISLVPTDYLTMTDTLLSNIMAYPDFDAAGWNEFTLTPAGIAAINITGITRLGFREHTHDALDNIPNFILAKTSWFQWRSADFGAPDKPYLWVEYTP